jgi:hypothetical protein
MPGACNGAKVRERTRARTMSLRERRRGQPRGRYLSAWLLAHALCAASRDTTIGARVLVR